MERAWKEAVVYQIYPRSFRDADGDGIGDLQGIIGKLDYIASLGVDAVWLGPIYSSPARDFGYDITDFRAVSEIYGTMDEFDALLLGLHERGIKLILDFVVNHTSISHPWFVSSRRSVDDPYRAYYFWRKPRADGGPPNNWESYSGGPAWKLDEATGEYYLRLFMEEQPDLNWDNPDVREEMYANMRFWLDRGVDGFRLDAANMISKPDGLPDSTNADEKPRGDGLFKNGPKIHTYLREMNERVFSRYPGIVTIGETPSVTPEEAAAYTAPERRELDIVFQMSLIRLNLDPDRPWQEKPLKVAEAKRVVAEWHAALYERGWYANYLNNHDHPRMLSRFPQAERYRDPIAKLLATLLLTLPGTPIVYQGEELGMTNPAFGDIGDYRDPNAALQYEEQRSQGMSPEEALKPIRYTSRDNARTPMQWDGSKGAGFTDGEPWMRINPDCGRYNAARAEAELSSILACYRTLIAHRRRHPAFAHGDYIGLFEDLDTLWGYVRAYEGEHAVVLLNFADREAELPPWPPTVGERMAGGRLLIGNYPDRETGWPAAGRLRLRPYEAVVYLAQGAD